MALVAAAAAVVAPTRPGWRIPERGLLALLGGALLVQFGLFAQKAPGIYLLLDWPGDYRPYFAGLACAALLTLAGLADVPPLRRVWFPLVLLLYLLLGAWVIAHAPEPAIDVFIFQQQGSAALLDGRNPYAITFPNIYGDDPVYGPGLVNGDRLAFGFPYPPLSLFLALPGYLIAGDHRYAQLLALGVAGALLALARPGRLGALAAVLLLFSPRIFFVLEQGWTEPFAILLLAATVCCACRWPRALPVALGLLLAVKQTLVFVPLLVPLLRGGLAHWRESWPLLWRAAAVALVVSLPLALGAPRDFVWSVVTLQIYQPLREDALSYVAWLARSGMPAPTWLAFAMVLLAAALALWRAARTPAGFAAGVALAFLAFFAFNKQAFCNYYFFVLGALCCALAAAPPEPSAAPAVGRPRPPATKHFRAARRR